MKRTLQAIVAGVCILILTGTIGVNAAKAAASPDTQDVFMMDGELERIIRRQLGDETGSLTETELDEINDFYYDGTDLISISGLERCSKLHM